MYFFLQIHRRASFIKCVSQFYSQGIILNPNKYNPLWITWQDGLFWLGSGNITGQNLYLSFYDPNPLAITDLYYGTDGINAAVILIPANYFIQGKRNQSVIVACQGEIF